MGAPGTLVWMPGPRLRGVCQWTGFLGQRRHPYLMGKSRVSCRLPVIAGYPLVNVYSLMLKMTMWRNRWYLPIENGDVP